MLHNIEIIYDKPIISTRLEHGLYELRLHDEKVSEMYDGPYEHTEYISFQKKTIQNFIESISKYEDWKVELTRDDSLKFCIIRTSEEKIAKNAKDKFVRVEPKEKPYSRIKFHPVMSFPFSTRASFCIYFDNIICTKMISDVNCLGPRKWIVEYNGRKIISKLFEKLGRRPTYIEIDAFKREIEPIIIEKMKESSETAKWVLTYDSEYAMRREYITSFDQY